MSPVSPVPSLIDEKKANSISSTTSPNPTLGDTELKYKSTHANDKLQSEVKQVSDDSSEFDGLTAMGEDEEQDESGRTPGRRQIGLFSAVFIIFNRIIGTGVFATPSSILNLSGSVGLSLIMWVIGAIIAAAGMQVYIVWGTALPKNGGEKNYLEYLFRRPRFLITSMFGANAVLLAWAAGNSLVFGEYILLAAQVEPTRWTLRLVGFACVSFAVLIHGTALKLGLCLQNFLGIFKVLVLLFIVVTGWVALGGYLRDFETDANGENFRNAFEGTKGSASGVCLCLYNVIWSYIGFSNVNYALSEAKNPQRTVRIAGPLAIAVVTVLYVLANIAYFSAATKEEITSGGRLVAALLFRNVYGPKTERALSVFVAMIALGNVMSVTFSQGRVNQDPGRKGILPFSKFWGSNRPFNAPLAGLLLHWAICLIVIFALPPGDAYNFVINVISYPLSVINAAISFGILWMAVRPYLGWPLTRAWSLTCATFFGAVNVFLFIVPLTSPPEGAEPYVSLPYWTHAVGGWAVFGIGAVYWVLWAVVAPRVGGYELRRVSEVGEDGLRRWVFKRFAKEE
ncbi:high affinity methionine permease [Agrocybe pediades]|nr:high affinity methionine permease [Agrocybe pediades]